MKDNQDTVVWNFWKKGNLQKKTPNSVQLAEKLIRVRRGQCGLVPWSRTGVSAEAREGLVKTQVVGPTPSVSDTVDQGGAWESAFLTVLDDADAAALEISLRTTG